MDFNIRQEQIKDYEAVHKVVELAFRDMEDSAPCWENIRALRYRFQADATLEAVPSTSILKVSARWERMYRLNAAQ